jgi:hypothetical protein
MDELRREEAAKASEGEDICAAPGGNKKQFLFHLAIVFYCVKLFKAGEVC